MTAPLTRVHHGAAPAPGLPRGRSTDAFAGFGTLLRFALRRDRIRLPAWTIGLTLLVAYFATVLGIVFPEPEDLAGFAVFGQNPAAALLMGRGFSGDPSLAQFLVGTYGLYLIIGASLASIFTVTRHTRVEEQTGRAELIRAGVVGRHTQLTVALAMALILDLALFALMGGMMVLLEYEPGSGFLFSASVAGAGLAFAGIAAVCVQVTSFGRAASGLAGAVLGGGFLLRGLADMSGTQDGALTWLSWLTPLGWSQEVAPFQEERWQPLLLSVACFAVMGAAGYLLAARRDLGAGLTAVRGGRARAVAWLGTPFGLAYRLQRPAIVGWSLAFLAAGLAYGGFTESMIAGFRDMPRELLALFGGEEDMLTGYLGMMGKLFAMFSTIFAVLSVQQLRGEETDGRSEAVLAAAVGRAGWLASWAAVSGLGVVVLQLAAGLGDAVGAVSSTGEGEQFGRILLGHIVHVPAVWLALAIAVLLYAYLPRLIGLVWVAFGFSFLVGFFGPLLDAPDWLVDLSPFEHVGEYPADEIEWTAVAVLSVAALAAAVVALAGFRRRDLTTK